MDLSVILVSYNTREFLAQALRTVSEASNAIEVEVFVVDNASKDGSPDMVAEQFPDVHLVRNARNLGFAAANNIALKQVSGRHVLLLNSDTIVRRDTLKLLVQFLDEHPEAGAVGCKILNPDGSLQPDCMRGFPTPMAAFCKISGLSRLFPNSRRLARYNMTYLDPQQTQQVEVLSGSCMMIRAETIAGVGLLDEGYFMYGEDIDWCYRMHSASWKLYYVPDTEIIHFRGESGRAEPMHMLYRKTEAMSIFANKHMQRRYRFFPLWLLHVGIVLHGTYGFVRHLGKKILMPAVDAALVLIGLESALALRYYDKLAPLMHLLEDVSRQIGLEMHPTRWLVPPAYSDLQWLVVFLAPLATWLLSFYALGLYDRHKFSIARTTVAVALGFAAILTMVFFFKDYNFSRLAAGAAWGLNTILIGGWRLGARWYVQSYRGHLYTHRLLLVGTDQKAVEFLGFLQQLGGLEQQVLGLVGTEQEERGQVVAGQQVIGLADELPFLIEEYGVDELIFTSGTISFARQKAGSSANVRVRLVPDSFPDILGQWRPQSAQEMPLIDVPRSTPATRRATR